MQPHASVIDVLENACDGLPAWNECLAMSSEARVELAALVDAFYDSYAPPPRAGGEFRSLFGDVVGREELLVLRYELSSAEPEKFGSMVAEAIEEGTTALLIELLYSDSVVVYDPLEFALALDNRQWTGRRDELRIDPPYIAAAVALLRALEPLVRAGLVHLIPARRIMHDEVEQVYSFAASAIPDPAWATVARPDWITAADPASDEHWREFYEYTGHRARQRAGQWGRVFATAAASDSIFLPGSPDSRRVWEWSLARAGTELAGADRELLVIPGLFAADLPWLRPRDARHLLSIRQDANAFAAWRASLRNCVRLVETTPAGSDFAADARSIFVDALQPEMERLRKTDLSSRLAINAKDEMMTFTFGAAGIAGASLGVGLPPIAALGVGAAARLILRTLLGRRLGADSAVLAHLARP